MFFAKVKQASVQCIVYFVQSIYAPPFENSSKCCCAMQNFALFRSQKHSEQILLARQSGLSFMNRNFFAWRNIQWHLKKRLEGVRVSSNYNSLCCILLKLSPLGLKKTIPSKKDFDSVRDYERVTKLLYNSIEKQLTGRFHTSHSGKGSFQHPKKPYTLRRNILTILRHSVYRFDFLRLSELD